MRQSNSFSLIEMIFILLILSILITIALPYFNQNIHKSNIVKLKNDLLLIQNGINQYNNTQVLLENPSKLETLDEDRLYLFSKILKTPIIASNKNGSWQKSDTTKYNFIFDATTFLEFEYDKNTALFMCDTTKDLCKEILR